MGIMRDLNLRDALYGPIPLELLVVTTDGVRCRWVSYTPGSRNHDCVNKVAVLGNAFEVI